MTPNTRSSLNGVDGFVPNAQIEQLSLFFFLNDFYHGCNEALHTGTLDLIRNERHHLCYHPKCGNDVYH